MGYYPFQSKLAYHRPGEGHRLEFSQYLQPYIFNYSLFCNQPLLGISSGELTPLQF